VEALIHQRKSQLRPNQTTQSHTKQDLYSDPKCKIRQVPLHPQGPKTVDVQQPSATSTHLPEVDQASSLPTKPGLVPHRTNSNRILLCCYSSPGIIKLGQPGLVECSLRAVCLLPARKQTGWVLFADGARHGWFSLMRKCMSFNLHAGKILE
jgi:hypothetical protein